MNKPDAIEPNKPPWFQRAWLVFLVAAMLVGSIFGVATAANAFGENIQGSVRCEVGSVSGVFIEADRAPRVPVFGTEVQSGLAYWDAIGPSAAVFDYWLPLGGAYSIHFGCGRLPGKPDSWAVDNRTPLVTGTGQHWACDQPVVPTAATLVSTTCQKLNI